MTRSLTDREAGWLAAMIEGDGYVSLNRNRQTPSASPIVCVINTDPRIIIESAGLMKATGAKASIVETPTSGRASTRWQAHVTSLEGVRVVLSEVVLAMRGLKKDIAELVLEYVELRLSRGAGPGIRGLTPSDREAEIIRLVRSMNSKGGKSHGERSFRQPA